jgi:hypothetical protein
MRRTTAALIVVVAAVFVLSHPAPAQPPKTPEERQQQREAAKPATKGELEALRQEVADLRAQIDILRGQLATAMHGSPAAGRATAAPQQPRHAAPAQGGAVARNKATLQQIIDFNWIDLKNPEDAKAVKDIQRLAPVVDGEVVAYLKDHPDLPPRVVEAAQKQEPAPEMPEDLLLIMGKYIAVKAENVRGRSVDFAPYGFSREVWHLVVGDGMVVSQSKEVADRGYRTLTR